MIKIETHKINDSTFDADAVFKGSCKELIQDLYVFHDNLQKNSEFALLYGIAINKWEKNNENN